MTERCYGLAGGVALVTGAGQGIGREIVRRLAAERVAVAVNGRTPAKVADTVAEITAAGGHALAVPGRVEIKADVQAMVEATLTAFGRIDYLVNNAGISRPDAFLDMAEESWDEQIAVNLKGSFLCGQAVARHMAEQGKGAIVNLCSIASYGGQAGRAAYAASKTGLLGLTRVMAQELGVKGIRVNAVAPGLIGTEMIARNIPAAFRDDIAVDRKPLGRMGEPREVAEAILFLLSDGASFMTGETMLVDGGLLSGYFYSARGGAGFKK
ncbi:MAG: glucose 1-dehydrogenase [Rhodospirillales bacterium]|nr:glucose 1-dehydrogenase [Rhodospirillales bacterium]